MNNGFYVFDVSDVQTDISLPSVSENNVPPDSEDTIPDEVETETVFQTVVEADEETVSGNDFVSVSSPADVSANSVFIPFDDSGVITAVGTLQTEVSLLNQNVTALCSVAAGISFLVMVLVFFTLFKWCEGKIKRFAKGVFNKYE